MKKIASLSLLSLVLAASAHAENISYGSYRILSNQKFTHQGRDLTTTYVIASNPDMAIFIEPPDSGTIKRIQSGTLKNCHELTGEQLSNFSERAQKANIAASQMQIAARLGNTSIPSEHRASYEYLKNLVVFENEAHGMPLYICEKILKK